MYDLSKPKEILSMFRASWISELMAEKKWNLKVEKLTEVMNQADVPKLENGDYSALFEAIKKMAGDAHAGVA